MLGKIVAVGLLACLVTAGQGAAPCAQHPSCIPGHESVLQSAEAARDFALQVPPDAAGKAATVGAWVDGAARNVSFAARDFAEGYLAGQQATVAALAASAGEVATRADDATRTPRQWLWDALAIACTCDPVVLPLTLDGACSPGYADGRAELVAKTDGLRRGALNAALGAPSDPAGSAGWSLGAAAGAPSTGLALTRCLAAA